MCMLNKIIYTHIINMNLDFHIYLQLNLYHIIFIIYALCTMHTQMYNNVNNSNIFK